MPPWWYFAKERTIFSPQRGQARYDFAQAVSLLVNPQLNRLAIAYI
jgi:hypothetical protein